MSAKSAKSLDRHEKLIQGAKNREHRLVFILMRGTLFYSQYRAENFMAPADAPWLSRDPAQTIPFSPFAGLSLGEFSFINGMTGRDFQACRIITASHPKEPSADTSVSIRHETKNCLILGKFFPELT